MLSRRWVCESEIKMWHFGVEMVDEVSVYWMRSPRKLGTLRGGWWATFSQQTCLILSVQCFKNIWMSCCSVCLWLFGCPEYILCVVSSKCSFKIVSVLWSQALGIRHSSGSGSKWSRWPRVTTVRVVRSIRKWSQHACLLGTSPNSWLLYENSQGWNSGNYIN